MSESVVSPLLATAALLAVGASVLVLLGVRSPQAVGLRSTVDRWGAWASAAVAGVAMAASLYYSEVVGFVPCEFCWFQRIAMYPLAVILLIAAITGDRNVWKYAVPLAAIGLLLSAYHYQLELFPEQATFCSSGVPCSLRHVEVYGFVSIPFMAGCGFVSILAWQFAMRIARR